MKTLIEQLTELSEKANRYDNQRGRYVDYAKRLKAVIVELAALAKELDPYVSLNSRGRPSKRRNTGKRGRLKQIMIEVYDKMLKGAEMSSDVLNKAYGLDGRQSHYVLSKIKASHKGVHKRTSGRNVIYYVQNTI